MVLTLSPLFHNSIQLYSSSQAAITKYHRLGGLNNRNLPFWRLKVWHQGASIVNSEESSLPDLQLAAFWLCPHMWPWEGRGKGEEREREGGRESSSSSCKTTVLSDYGPILMTSFTPTYLLKTLSPYIVTFRVRTSTYEFWGNTIRSIAPIKWYHALKDTLQLETLP